jgi:hypothetical protein
MPRVAQTAIREAVGKRGVSVWGEQAWNIRMEWAIIWATMGSGTQVWVTRIAAY